MTGQPDGSPSAAPEPAEGCEDTAFSLFMSISPLKTRKEKDEPFTFVFHRLGAYSSQTHQQMVCGISE